MEIDLDQLRSECNDGMVSRIGKTANKIFFNLAVRNTEAYNKPKTPNYFNNVRERISKKEALPPVVRCSMFDGISREKREITKKSSLLVPAVGLYHPNYTQTQKAPRSHIFAMASKEILRKKCSSGQYSSLGGMKNTSGDIEEEGLKEEISEDGDTEERGFKGAEDPTQILVGGEGNINTEEGINRGMGHSESQPILMGQLSLNADLFIPHGTITIFGRKSPTTKHIPGLDMAKLTPRKGGIFGIRSTKRSPRLRKKTKKQTKLQYSGDVAYMRTESLAKVKEETGHGFTPRYYAEY